MKAENPTVAFDSARLLARRFPAVRRAYDARDVERITRGYGAGLGPALEAFDRDCLAGAKVLPMLALALADGEFWQKDPDTGIDWRRIVHAEEVLTVHAPLPAAGAVVVTQRVAAISDRGPDKGAVMEQQQFLHAEDGTALATIDVTTLLRGNGGFGGPPWSPRRRALPADRAPDLVVELRAPGDNEDAMFRLGRELAVAADGKAMMRGLGCFGLAGRAALQAACGGQPERLRRMGVRYVGPMYCGEALLVELWHGTSGEALFRMSAPERSAPVLDNCFIEFDAE